jgi:predicted glycosyl hydrolase (DUF1957 family)
MYWAPLLHIYQPPWQDVEVLKRINNECYVPLLNMVDRHDNAKITLNIQGCLLDLLHENAMDATIEMLRRLIAAGKIEVVGTAMYHPILPLIPEKEIQTQIAMNEETNLKYFGEIWRRGGFFPPEMAVSSEICPIIKKQGYKWMIMSGIASLGDWPINHIVEHSSGLITLFRDDYLSNDISFQQINAPTFVSRLNTMYPINQQHYVITAMDGETFGHHIKNYETSFLGKTFSLLEDRPQIKPVFISQLLEIFPVKQGPDFRASTWSTDYSDIMSNVPYPLWKHPFNPMHKVQYRMLKALYDLMEIADHQLDDQFENPDFMHYYQTARWFYNEALHSCWLWWASQRPHWSPNLIYKGVNLVMQTALNAQLALIGAKNGEGDEPYTTIMSQMEQLMTTIIAQELAQKKIRTF